jgi:cbb3-type cytochrome oxidase maturation protein
MEILYLLIPLSVVLVFLVGAAFWWSVAHGQFDDLEGPAHRILSDDDGWPVTSDSVLNGSDMAPRSAPGARRRSEARVGPIASSGNTAIGAERKPDGIESGVTGRQVH